MGTNTPRMQDVKLGDLLHIGPLLGNLVPEEIILQAVSLTKGPSPVIEFHATYFGVHLGNIMYDPTPKGLQWYWKG